MNTFNFLLSNFTLSTATETADLELIPGHVAMFEVLIESVTGSPTAASLAAKFQVAPFEAKGYNINQFTSGDTQQWQDVISGDGKLGHLLLDGDWPASLANQSVPAWSSISRRIFVPPLARILRLRLTPSFTGGTAPAFKVTAAVSSYKP